MYPAVRRPQTLRRAILLSAVVAAMVAAGTLSSSSADVPVGSGYAGLVRADTGACAGEYRVVGVELRGRPACSHGPDGFHFDAYAGAKGSDGTGTRGGRKGTSSTTTTAPPAPTPTGARCGTDGQRVQAIYAHAADVPSRYGELLPSLRQWAAKVDDIVSLSAAATGGVRHVRYVTDASCTPVIADVTLSPAGDDDLSSTINELQGLGYNRTDRKYLVWMDASAYCGIGTVQSDDSASTANRNNTGPSYGRVDAGCWGTGTEAHELIHNLGGVQLSAPHSNASWHCSDESDLMCYEENGKAMTYPCPLSDEQLLDCGHDDYFSTAPETGGYLATHWNSANSSFLTSLNS